MLRFREALFGRVQQNAACNALHPLEDRLARWLLQALDLIGEGELRLTQEALAKMLGVRRTSVTIIANRLQADGLIRYRRGTLWSSTGRDWRTQRASATALSADEPVTLRVRLLIPRQPSGSVSGSVRSWTCPRSRPGGWSLTSKRSHWCP